MKPKYVYHGSQYLLHTIKPHQATGLVDEHGDEFGIYAFDEKDKTIAFALPIQKNKNGNRHFELDIKTGKITLYAGDIDINGKGYIYKVSSETFKLIGNNQYLSTEEVTPIEVITIYVKDYMHLIQDRRKK